MSVPKNTEVRTTTTSSGPGVSLPPEVERFIESHAVEQHPVPFTNCPQCGRTLHAATLFFVGPERITVWAMRCPLTGDLYGAQG